MTAVRFSKYEAIGNDFLLALGERGDSFAPGEVVALLDRHRGVGADGLISLGVSDASVVEFSLCNADGSVAETSGNGLRCAALFARAQGLGDAVSFETLGGRVETRVLAGDDKAADVRVEMGRALVAGATSPVADSSARAVDVGNPHLVVFDGALDAVDLVALGAALNETTRGGVNLELVEVLDAATLSLRVYERGVGVTLACGSGSVAAAAALHEAGRVDALVRVVNPGGSLEVELVSDGPRAYLAALTGPARHVAEVELDLGALESNLLEHRR